MSETYEIQDAPVFSYVMASADMRHSGIGERDIYLRNNAKKGLLFQGEISGCGSGCFVDLSQILLEYAMSCEGCGEDHIASEEAVRFGKRLAEILAVKLNQNSPELSPKEKIAAAVKIILNSMGASYMEAHEEDRVEYIVNCCPLSECGKNTGLASSAAVAHIAFVALCQKLLTILAPDWVLQQPAAVGGKIPIHKIVIAKL